MLVRTSFSQIIQSNFLITSLTKKNKFSSNFKLFIIIYISVQLILYFDFVSDTLLNSYFNSNNLLLILCSFFKDNNLICEELTALFLSLHFVWYLFLFSSFFIYLKAPIRTSNMMLNKSYGENKHTFRFPILELFHSFTSKYYASHIFWVESSLLGLKQ